MHGLRDELFARTALAGDLDRHRALRGLRERGELLRQPRRHRREPIREWLRERVCIPRLAAVIAKHEDGMPDDKRITVDERVPRNELGADPRAVLRPDILEHPTAADA